MSSYDMHSVKTLSSSKSSDAPPLSGLLERVWDGHALSDTEALRLLSLTQAEERHALAETASQLQRQQTGELVHYTTGLSLFLTNICEMAPPLYAYPTTDSQRNARSLTIDDLDSALEHIKRDQLRQLTLYSGGYSSFLQIPGLECPTLLKTYTRVVEYIRENAPSLHFTAFSPDEIDFLAVVSGRSERYILEMFQDHGLQELGGAGTGVLVDAVRQQLSPKKTTVRHWFEIVEIAYQLTIPVIASLELGHFETRSHRLMHLRHLQRFLQKHPNAFSRLEPIIVPVQASFIEKHQAHIEQHQAQNVPKKTSKTNKTEPAPNLPALQQHVTHREQQNWLALSRLLLGEWLPHQQVFRRIGAIEEAQAALQWGANGFGSSDTGVYEQFLAGAYSQEFLAESDLQAVIREAGWTPQVF